MNNEENTKLSHDWLINAVKEKHREKQLEKFISIEIEPINANGVGFTSDVTRIKMVFSNETGNKQITVILVAKVNKPAGNQDGENFWNNRTEVEVYFNVLHQMEDLMMEFNDKRETLWPDMYGHVPYTVLLLEDLGQRYKMLPRTVELDDEHALLGLRSLARYHAMSKILIERGVIGENYRCPYLIGSENTFHDKFVTGTAHLLYEAMTEQIGHWKSVESCEYLRKKLQRLLPTIYKRRVECYLNYDKRFDVLNHGDYKSGNMMFRKMEYTGYPTEVKFFDFQSPHINSFAWDVIFFFVVSIQPSLRRAHRSELLEAYQRSLADNLKFFNFEGYIPTVDEVKKEIERLALVEFTFMTSVTPIVISSLNNTMTLEKVTTHPPEEAFNKMIFGEETFVNGVVSDFERAIELKVI